MTRIDYPLDYRLVFLHKAEFDEFTIWLRECCGYEVVTALPTNRQYEAYLQWLDECRSEEDP